MTSVAEWVIENVGICSRLARVDRAAADAVQKLIDYALKQDQRLYVSQSGWIHPRDSRPAKDQDVLCCWGKEFGVATYSNGHWVNPEDDCDSFRTPDFWMPMPERPQSSHIKL